MDTKITITMEMFIVEKKSDKLKEPPEIEELSSSHYKFFITSKAFGLFNLALKYGTYCFSFWVVKESIISLAGKETNAKIQLLLDMATKDAESFLPWILTSFFCLWALGERKLRYKKVEFFHERNKKLELLLDPNRKGSMLTKQGKTNPEDCS